MRILLKTRSTATRSKSVARRHRIESASSRSRSSSSAAGARRGRRKQRPGPPGRPAAQRRAGPRGLTPSASRSPSTWHVGCRPLCKGSVMGPGIVEDPNSMISQMLEDSKSVYDRSRGAPEAWFAKTTSWRCPTIGYENARRSSGSRRRTAPTSGPASTALFFGLLPGPRHAGHVLEFPIVRPADQSHRATARYSSYQTHERTCSSVHDPDSPRLDGWAISPGPPLQFHQSHYRVEPWIES